MDRIVVFHNGAIVEDGKQEDSLASQPQPVSKLVQPAPRPALPDPTLVLERVNKNNHHEERRSNNERRARGTF